MQFNTNVPSFMSYDGRRYFWQTVSSLHIYVSEYCKTQYIRTNFSMVQLGLSENSEYVKDHAGFRQENPALSDPKGKTTLRMSYNNIIFVEPSEYARQITKFSRSKVVRIDKAMCGTVLDAKHVGTCPREYNTPCKPCRFSISFEEASQVG